LSTFQTDERYSLRDTQHRLILLTGARYTAHRQFEDRACFDHEKFYRSYAPGTDATMAREKRGEAEPEERPAIFVQLGAATEELNRSW
jgi:hypothetical protein